MTETGRITSQQVLNAALSVLLALLGLLWAGMDKRVERAEAQGTVAGQEVAAIKAQGDEVLRRLGRIEAKLDREPLR